MVLDQAAGLWHVKQWSTFTGHIINTLVVFWKAPKLFGVIIPYAVNRSITLLDILASNCME